MAQVDSYELRKKAEADWRTSPAIREEFSDMEIYFSFLKAEASGQVKFAPSTVR